MSFRETTLLVPVKQFDRSKTRLQPPMKPEDRQQLMKLLVDHQLSQLEPLHREVSSINMVTRERWVIERLNESPVNHVPEPSSCETLGEVVDRAIEAIDPPGGVGVFPVDLPLISTDDLRFLLKQFRNAEVGLVPDREHGGTNFLWRNPGRVISCQYSGTESFHRHRDRARSSDYRSDVVESPPVMIDLDEPVDIETLLGRTDRLSEQLHKFLKNFVSSPT